MTTEQVKAPVRAAFAPATDPTRSARRATDRGGAPQWKLTVTFRARVAADSRPTYAIETTRPRSGSGCTGMISPRSPGTSTVGETVRQVIYIPANCQGSVRGKVTFRPQSSGPQQGLSPGALGEGTTVGDFEVQIPTPGGG